MKRCRICTGKLFDQPLLRYENMPAVAQNFPDSNSITQDCGVDLEVVQCRECGLVQLNSEPVSYFRGVIRAAGYSKEMGEFRRRQFSEFLKVRSLVNKKVIEIGCGRGEYLSLMEDCGADTYGIEHLRSSVEECLKNGLKVNEDFVEKKEQELKGAPFDAFFCLNFLEHIPDVPAFLQGIRNNLTDQGVGLIEVPNFDMILREQMFCEFMTDHLYYFSKETFVATLATHGFEVLECKEVWQDYILSAVVKKSPNVTATRANVQKLDLSAFSQQQTQLEKNFSDYVAKFPAGSIAIWGAGHQALAVMSLAKLGGKIKYVLDSAPFKQNKFTPATHIPIVSPQKIEEDLSIQAVIVMGASYSDEIVKNLKNKHRKNLKVAVFRSNQIEMVK